MRFFAVLAIAILGFLPARAHDANATYLGNEGVMVTRGDTKILFDAFYADSYDQYVLVPRTITNALLSDTPPFDGVDAIFVSHVHGDHFSAEPTIAYLRAHGAVTFYAPLQVREALLDAGLDENDPLLSRVKAFDLGPDDDPVSFEVGGLSVDVVAIPHAGDWPEIQNFVWRVAMDDKTTVMHLGDAGTVRSDFERHANYFAAKKTHAAFIPYWFYLNEAGRGILGDYLKADQTIGMHVPAVAIGNGDAYREQAGGDLFTDPGETRQISSKD
ncbi:MAG: MBL fold metallo-hydrolase [Pseudomonadota bacterium]